MSKIFTAIGLMSGTSMDGIDAALIRSDGSGRLERTGISGFFSYDHKQRRVLNVAARAGRLYAHLERETTAPLAARQKAMRQCLGHAEDLLTEWHGEAVQNMLQTHGLQAGVVDVVGFHGHTVLHRPERGFTLQIGDGAALAQRLGISVVADFRSADVAAGGQGAPLVPVYHRALVRSSGLQLPVAMVNVGGVANVTYIGADDELIAFDTGPGNALIDDWMALRTGEAMDCGGTCARGGEFSEKVLGQLLVDPYFSLQPPKSLDRDYFKKFALPLLGGLSTEMGARTLTVFTVMSVARADCFFPMPPRHWIICGGGTRNDTMMDEFRKRLDGEVRTADELGWSSDFMEAEAFAYLALRSMNGLPLSFPSTTGVRTPQTGGVLFQP